MYYDKVDKVYYELVNVEADEFVMKDKLASGFPDLDKNGVTVTDIHDVVKKSLNEKGYEWDGKHEYLNGAMTRGSCCIINETFKNKDGNILSVDTSVGCRGDFFALTYSFYDPNPDVVQKITDDVKDVSADVLRKFGKENYRKTSGYLHFAIHEEATLGDIQFKSIDVDFNKTEKLEKKSTITNLSPDYSKGKSDAILHK